MVIDQNNNGQIEAGEYLIYFDILIYGSTTEKYKINFDFLDE